MFETMSDRVNTALLDRRGFVIACCYKWDFWNGFSLGELTFSEKVCELQATMIIISSTNFSIENCSVCLYRQPIQNHHLHSIINFYTGITALHHFPTLLSFSN